MGVQALHITQRLGRLFRREIKAGFLLPRETPQKDKRFGYVNSFRFEKNVHTGFGGTGFY